MTFLSFLIGNDLLSYENLGFYDPNITSFFVLLVIAIFHVIPQQISLIDSFLYKNIFY